MSSAVLAIAAFSVTPDFRAVQKIADFRKAKALYKKLGVTIPNGILLAADEVIDWR
jgi:hypothetical protein